MKGKRIGKIIFYLFSAVCLLLVLWGLIGKLVAEKKGEKFYLFGYSLEIVVTDSMTPTINVGTLVVLKKADINEINAAEKTGDVICYRSRSGSLKGKSILHRAVEKRTEDGIVYLTTRGDKEGSPTDQQSADLQPEITAENLLGISVFQSYVLGRILVVLRHPLTWVFLIWRSNVRFGYAKEMARPDPARVEHTLFAHRMRCVGKHERKPRQTELSAIYRLRGGKQPFVHNRERH